MNTFTRGDEIKEIHRAITRVLLNWLEKYPGRVISYGELAERANRINPQSLGPYLGDISTECHDQGLPLISAIVVLSGERMPSYGFYDLACQLHRPDIDIEAEQASVFEQKNWQGLRNIMGL